MNGFLNVLKPPGMTSSDVVVLVRRSLSGEKVGHAGTLDPEAAGVLPIMIGKASRLFDVLVDKDKQYLAEIAFGASTDTQDAQGRVMCRSDMRPDRAQLEAVLPRFVGELSQIPPAYSALKVDGHSAHALARAGHAPVLKARQARVDGLRLTCIRPPDAAMLLVDCGRGVYVRTLCHDIGEALGCHAHMRFLLRTRSGGFSLEESVTLEDWMRATDREALLSAMDAPLAHLPMARISAHREADCRNGKPFPLANLDEYDPRIMHEGLSRIYCGEKFAGLARWRGDALRIQAMLL